MAHTTTMMTMTTTTMATTTTTITPTAATSSSEGPWSVTIHGTLRLPAEARKAKCKMVKPAVEAICQGGNIVLEAAVLRAVADHPALNAAREPGGIETSKTLAVCKFLCIQSSRMMECARNGESVSVNTLQEKRDTVEVVLTFSAPSPKKTADTPSMRDRARIMGVPYSTLQCVENSVIKKQRQLTAAERGLYWALSKCKKGYSTINNELQMLLIVAFNDHPHVVVSPNMKDTLQLKNADGEKVLVRKILTIFGLGTIFSDIVRDNSTIKNTVGECAFRYLIRGLGCMRGFTHSHKIMCGCTKCVGLQTLHCLLQAKRGVVQWQIAIDLQHQSRKARADVMPRGWGDVGWHTTPLDAIRVGTCARWAAHPVPHWECLTLQCGNCSDYPVPTEEACKDAGAEDISFHVYEYKVLLRADTARSSDN